MKRSTHLMMVCAYYYAQIVGILNFSYDYRRQKAYKSTAITVYSLAVNVLLFTVIPYFALTLEMKSRPAGSATLIYNLSIILTLIRISAVLIAVVFNWTKRNAFIALINSYQTFSQHLLQKCKRKQKYDEYIERGIRNKCKISLVLDSMLFYFYFEAFRDIFAISNVWIVVSLAMAVIMLNIVMLHYYFALHNVNACLLIICEELERILKESKEYELLMATDMKSQSLSGYFKQISDYVNYLASSVLRLQDFVKRINNIYEVQGVCCMLILFLSNVCTIYMNFMTSSPDNLWNRKNSFYGYFVMASIVLYYYDLKLFIYSMLDAVDWVQKLANLLKMEQVLLPFKDKILERRVTNFSLQLAAVPLEIGLVGLYKANKPMVFSIFSSTIAVAIVLKQYDFQYS